MPPGVWGHSLAGQGWNLLGSRCHVLLQLEANAGSAKGMSIPVYEDGFVVLARLPFQKSFQQVDSLGPKGRDSFLALFAEQVNVKGGLQVKVARREVQGLLDTRSGVVKDRAQDVITLALALRAIRFSENCCDLIFVQRTHGTFRGFFRGNTQNLRSEEHTSELQSRLHLVCRLLLEKKKSTPPYSNYTPPILSIYPASLTPPRCPAPHPSLPASTPILHAGNLSLLTQFHFTTLCLILTLQLGNLFLIVELHFRKLFAILKSGVNHTTRVSSTTSTLPSIKFKNCSSKTSTSNLFFFF